MLPLAGLLQHLSIELLRHVMRGDHDDTAVGEETNHLAVAWEDDGDDGSSSSARSGRSADT